MTYHAGSGTPIGRRFNRVAAKPTGNENHRQLSFCPVWFRNNCPQSILVRGSYRIINHIDVRITFTRRFHLARKFTSRKGYCERQRKSDLRSKFHLLLAALTTFCAASARSSAAISARPLSFSSRFPASTF